MANLADRELGEAKGGQGSPLAPAPSVELGDLRFRRLLGEVEWNVLPPVIRQRFSHRLGPGDSIVYSGVILETWMTGFGRLAAALLRLIGAPLPLEANNPGAAAIVTVTERPDGLGQFWTRTYTRRRGFPQVIHSTKMFTGETGLEETVGAGVTMSVRLIARDDRLLFASERYLLKLGPLRIPVPGALCVGRIVAGHVARGPEAFEFTLDVRHPLLGLVIRQRALFRERIERDDPPC